MAAYTYVMLGVLLIAGAVAWAYCIPALNDVTGLFNKQVVAGHVSEQTRYVYNWNLIFVQWFPAILLGGGGLFFVVRGTEVSTATGGSWG